MNAVYEKLLRCYVRVKEFKEFKPTVAVVLGSGLGAFAERIRVEATLGYKEIKDFPTSTVEGHEGRYVFGYVDQVPVMLMQGRVHYYEGYPMDDVVLPVRLMGMMGAGKVLLTNAAGGINEDYAQGDFMLIADHVASFVPSPLIGENMDELGVRFPDMGSIYSESLRSAVRKAARKSKIKLKEGVYLQTSGPNYESPSEVKMYRALGADAVGMSTAVEAVAAKHMGMEVCGISCITNMASGVSAKEVMNHDDVREAARRSEDAFTQLVWDAITNMGA